ncbi:hypothetical protein DSO57_1034412 [Entomophthora muscae]|uniref:Uncharacterized protein n=2 Tax=Entomophthora muscae TaxID=34485 RepID=A0ACC2TAX5_9FUNG|nr:hypothetical protein DSO57_1031836 [Entomophthora muscae]KAJ9071697.1 hypothetical protein DSO57_1034412 [Entomophthora muscae]
MSALHFSRTITRQALFKCRGFHWSSIQQIKVGETAPSATVMLKSPGETTTILEHFKRFNKAILISVPGAFTPSCTSTHVPSFVKLSEELKAKGVDEVACISVNDTFVMSAWGEKLQVEGKVTLLSDPSAEASKALGLAFDIPPLGGTRAKRAVIIFKNGVAEKVIEEPDNTTLTITHADHVIKEL